ncbi:hypothetical protein [Bradyrhizobium australafricanum]|uniref:hypothetical protein n=1 Tax=Bradyrhizobium australafricanum TaxID=2821406 RepID=UPI001CE352E7|nr:hypothetical protein [Bradyrhizobium australafricanum]MCA6103979.1 hypothetical protein [Bradyrhizobium australafricanum]
MQIDERLHHRERQGCATTTTRFVARREADLWRKLHKLCDAEASTANKLQRALLNVTFEPTYVLIVSS